MNNMNKRIRIAVIGAGMCGIAAVRVLKEEGLDPTCFEKTAHHGGLWRYHEDDIEGEASVMRTTIINNSKELGAVSNFPPPKNFPNYMPHNMMFEYITMIAEEFHILRHIKYHHEVVSVLPSDDYQDTGKWIVSTRNTQNETNNSEIFDGVMVCVGHHVYPNVPNFPGIDIFQGKIMHSHSLKSNEGFKDKKVLVIGAGSSAIDAATDISVVAKQVYLSSRRGFWLLPRMGPKGRPFDVIFLRRSLHFLQNILPYSLVCSFSEGLLNMSFNHSTYNIKPSHRIWSQHPTVSDVLPVTMISGGVLARRNIKTFVRNGVIFEGEEDVTEVDAVILATGYQIKFPFLSEDIVRVEDNRVNFYKRMYPPDLPHPSLVFIGFAQLFGALLPLAEMQLRWATRVMCGKCSLPPKKAMWKDIQKKERFFRKKFANTLRYTLEVDLIDYVDDLAVLIGAKPNFWKMAVTDPKLFWACMTGPYLPYQYRLQGPHPWDGARKAILSYKEREVAPFGASRKRESVHENEST